MTKKKLWLLIILLTSTLLYILISIVNHLCFRTYALDLGVYTTALYDYSHFKIASTISFTNSNEILLSDHFDLYLILFSPLSYIFGNYTLLVIQIVAVLIGGYGIFKVFNILHPKITFSAVISFFLFFGILSAIGYDYHSNLVASCLMPWLFYFVIKDNTKMIFVIFILTIISKENFSLFLFMFFLCLPFAKIENAKKNKKIFFALSLVSLIYFLLITTYIMPSLSLSGKFTQFRYSVLGENYSEAFSNIIQHPIKYLSILFTNHTNNVNNDYIKLEFWIFLLMSGGLFLFFNLPFLFMLLPIFAQKLFHDQPEMWGINDQYCAEIAPVLIIGVFHGITKNRILNQQINILKYFIPLFIVVVSIRMMDLPVSKVRKDNLRIYKINHYQSQVNYNAFNKVYTLIPKNAKLCAQCHLYPHFAWRDNIYMFPNIHDAKYIILNINHDYWPLTENVYKEKLHELLQNNQWEVIFDKCNLMLLKKT